MFEKRMVKWFLFVLWIASAFFSFSFAQESVLWLPVCSNDAYNKVLAERLVATSPKNAKQVISAFCDAAVAVWWCSYSKDMIYLPKDSVFLSLLCTHVDVNARKGFFNPKLVRAEDGYLLNSSFIKKREKTKNCTDATFSNCDLSSFLTSLFSTIMNDYFSLQQAWVYWAKDLTSSSEEQANLFSQQYYMLSICDGEKNYYPKTCKVIKKYISSASQLFKQLTLINLDGIKKNDAVSCDTSAPSSSAYDLVYCWLYWSSTSSPYTFINLVYNEFFWYRLFISYYSPLVLSDQNIYKEVTKEKLLQDIEDMNALLQKNQQAVNLSFRILRERRNTFPLHIGFLMYQEDVNLFMKAMAKIYTPFVTLHDKFINVQEK